MLHQNSRVLSLVVVGLGLVAGGGCVSRILAPPARFQPLESPRFVGEGKTGIELEGGSGGEVFAGNAFGGTVRLRRGLSDDLELTGEGSVAYVEVDATPSQASRVWGGARVGVRGRFASGFEHAWWGVGVGGGSYAGGGFISPDLAVGIGWVNPYFIPYLQLGLHTSLPIAPQVVDTSDEETAASDKGEVTFGTRVAVGFEIPIADVVGLDFGMTWVHLEEVSGTRAEWFGLAGKVSVTF